MPWPRANTLPQNGVLIDGKEATSLFAVLAMTGKTTPPSSHAVYPGLVSCNGMSVLQIAREIFPKNMVLPRMEVGFASADASAFALTNNDQRIQTARKIRLSSLKMADGSLRDAVLAPETVTLDQLADHRRHSMTDFCREETPGISVHIQYVSSAELFLADATRHRAFRQSPETCVPMVSERAAVTWTHIIPNVILCVAGAVVGGVPGKALGVCCMNGEGVAEAGVGVLSEEGANTIRVVVDMAELGPEDYRTFLEAATQAAWVEAMYAIEGIDLATETGDFLRLNWPKILGSIIGAGLGAPIANIPKFTEMGTQDIGEDQGAMDQFTTQTASPFAWPGATGSGLPQCGSKGRSYSRGAMIG